MSDWRKHDGGANPVPGQAVDLQWGFGIILGQSSAKVNWSLPWTWRPSPTPEAQPTQADTQSQPTPEGREERS